MTNMFKLWKESEIYTVNPFNGCMFGCYGGKCWASLMARRHEGKGTRGYENGFDPSWCPWRIEENINSEVCWIGSMGDWAFQPLENIYRIIEEMIEPNPDTLFFTETKQPSRYTEITHRLPDNVMISTTVETNRGDDYERREISKAPNPKYRYLNFRAVDWNKKHLSIEPIMDFDHFTMVQMVKDLDPEIVSIGYDNYNCGLPEPAPNKFWRLVDDLKEITEVEVKTEPSELERY